MVVICSSKIVICKILYKMLHNIKVLLKRAINWIYPYDVTLFIFAIVYYLRIILTLSKIKNSFKMLQHKKIYYHNSMTE